MTPLSGCEAQDFIKVEDREAIETVNDIEDLEYTSPDPEPWEAR